MEGGARGRGGTDRMPSPVPPPKHGTVVLWLRRELRVTDNRALWAACQAARLVIPVFIWAPEEEGQLQPGRCSRWWLHESLTALEHDLQSLGSGLVYRQAKESRQALLQLVRETGAEAVYWNRLYDSISLVRDEEVRMALEAVQVQCQAFRGDVLYEPWEVLSDARQPFTSFQAFWHRVQHMEVSPAEPLPVPDALPPLPAGLASTGLGGLELMTAEEAESNQQLFRMWTPGGEGAFLGLQRFLQRKLPAYSRARGKMDCSGTSLLSPHVHYGEISVGFVYHVVQQRLAEGGGRAGCEDFLRQLGFREYSRYLSFHFPFTHERSLLAHLRAVPFRLDQALFKAWRQGNTGYPMVDASMRQLWSTGWLHNRSRVLCASFLVKNLLLPWQWGLKHYWDCLLDADLECDALGWQYCSGCLADAPPFEHLPDAVAQAQAFDPDGNFVRRWIPTLARLPSRWIHRPWEAPAQVLRDAGVELGQTYPLPLISPQESRRQLRRAAKAVRAALERPGGSPQAPFRPPSMPPGRRAEEVSGTEAGATLASAEADEMATAVSEIRQGGAAAGGGGGGLAGRKRPRQPEATDAAAAAAAAAAAGEQEEVLSNTIDTDAEAQPSRQPTEAGAPAQRQRQQRQQEAEEEDDSGAAQVPDLGERGRLLAAAAVEALEASAAEAGGPLPGCSSSVESSGSTGGQATAVGRVRSETGRTQAVHAAG